MNLNLAIALERVGGDEELLREIAGLFLEDCPTLMTKIEQAVATNDAFNLERAAHSLKGSIANFGSEAAYQASLDLEQIGRSKDLAKMHEAHAKLVEVMAHVTPELQALSGAS